MSRRTTTKPAVARPSRSFGSFVDPYVDPEEVTIPQTTPEAPRMALDPAEAVIAWAQEFRAKQGAGRRKALASLEGRTFADFQACANCRNFSAEEGGLCGDGPNQGPTRPDDYCGFHNAMAEPYGELLITPKGMAALREAIARGELGRTAGEA